MSSLCQAINEVANRMNQNNTVSQNNLCRADLRLLADRAKEMEIDNMELRRRVRELERFQEEAERNGEEDLAITLALGPPTVSSPVVHLDRFRRVPIEGGAA